MRRPPPFANARIYVATEGGLRYLNRTMADPTLLRVAAEFVRPGDTVGDVGGNMGLFDFAAGVAVGPTGHVLAVGPTPTWPVRLWRSAADNTRQASVDVLSAAVINELSVARSHIARRNRSTNYLAGFGSTMTGGERSTRLVPTATRGDRPYSPHTGDRRAPGRPAAGAGTRVMA